MRTTLTIDPKLLEEVIALTGERSKSKAVSMALAEYVWLKRVDELRAIAGKIDLVDNLDELEELELEEMRRDLELADALERQSDANDPRAR